MVNFLYNICPEKLKCKLFGHYPIYQDNEALKNGELPLYGLPLEEFRCKVCGCNLIDLPESKD